MNRIVFLGRVAVPRPDLLWKAPVGLLIGLLVGLPVGAIYLPYLALDEGLRIVGQVWPYLAGWTEWAENRPPRPAGKKGWLLVWVVWVWLYFASACTWAPLVGCALGPVLGVWVAVVPDGWPRFLAAARRWRQSLQALDLRRLATTG